MFRFILPFTDGTVINIALGGNKDVHEAFSEFRRYYWIFFTRRVRKHSLLWPFGVNRFVPRQLK